MSPAMLVFDLATLDIVFCFCGRIGNRNWMKFGTQHFLTLKKTTVGFFFCFPNLQGQDGWVHVSCFGFARTFWRMLKHDWTILNACVPVGFSKFGGFLRKKGPQPPSDFARYVWNLFGFTVSDSSDGCAGNKRLSKFDKDLKIYIRKREEMAPGWHFFWDTSGSKLFGSKIKWFLLL